MGLASCIFHRRHYYICYVLKNMGICCQLDCQNGAGMRPQGKLHLYSRPHTPAPHGRLPSSPPLPPPPPPAAIERTVSQRALGSPVPRGASATAAATAVPPGRAPGRPLIGWPVPRGRTHCLHWPVGKHTWVPTTNRKGRLAEDCHLTSGVVRGKP